MAAEAELRKLADDYRRLREELLPIFKMAKDRSQPLPYQPNLSYSGSTLTPDYHDQSSVSPNAQQEKPEKEKTGSSLGRTLSKKLFASGSSASKNSSPTHIPQSIPENRPYHDSSTLDPSAAAMAASSHLTASANGQPSPKGIPSPTSPASFYTQQTLGSRAYSRDPPYAHPDDGHPSRQPSIREHPPPSTARSTHTTDQGSSTGSNGPSVEIFKSFRVSMDDPCHKILPAALKKYNIHEDWRLYALYIVHGDQERCLGLEERPLILFKQLEKEGKKPMFMLRKQAPMPDGQQPPAMYPGSAGIGIPTAGVAADGGGSGNRNQAPQLAPIQLPGGVL